jgi:hypothetical protein
MYNVTVLSKLEKYVKGNLPNAAKNEPIHLPYIVNFISDKQRIHSRRQFSKSPINEQE